MTDSDMTEDAPQPARDSNTDPLSGAPGAHPIGTAAGAAGGAAAGAAAGGMLGGPVGLAVGGVVGAVAGGLAGSSVAEMIDPTGEDEYWRDNYSSRPYVQGGDKYENHRPAYRYGWESRARNVGKEWSDVEDELSSGWDKARGESKMAWSDAKRAARDAWTHATDGRQKKL